MKKKTLVFALAIFLVVICVFALASCDMILGGGGNEECNGNHSPGGNERVVDPTCEEYGKVYVTCSDCGEEYVIQERVGEPLGHTYSDSLNCDRCEKEYVDTNLIFKLNEAGDGYIVAWHYDEEFVSAQYSGNYRQYWLDNNNARTGFQHAIVIPAEYNGKPVVEVAPFGFSMLLDKDTFEVSTGEEVRAATGKIRFISIPSSVKVIGECAFANIEAEFLALGDGVEIIGEDAFNGIRVTNISFPNSVQVIGDGAFNYSKLKSVALPSSLQSVGEDAFPKGLLSITLNANPNLMTEFELPNTVNTIINNTEVEFSLEDAENWLDGEVLSYFDFRKTDINRQMTVYADGREWSGTPKSEIPVILFYTNIDGNNYLTDIYDTFTGVLETITVPDGITHIEKAGMFSEFTTITLPNSVRWLSGDLFTYTRTITMSEATDISALYKDSNQTIVTREDNTAATVKLDYKKLLEGLKAENSYTYVYGGVKFEFSSVGGIGEIKEITTFGEPYIQVGLNDLQVVISFVNPEDERVPVELSIDGRDAWALSNKKFEIYGYYYNAETDAFVLIEEDRNDRSFSDLVFKTLKYELAGDQTKWKLTLDSDEGEGLDFRSIEIKFEPTKYNADLTEQNH